MVICVCDCGDCGVPMAMCQSRHRCPPCPWMLPCLKPGIHLILSINWTCTAVQQYESRLLPSHACMYLCDNLLCRMKSGIAFGKRHLLRRSKIPFTASRFQMILHILFCTPPHTHKCALCSCVAVPCAHVWLAVTSADGVAAHVCVPCAHVWL